MTVRHFAREYRWSLVFYAFAAAILSASRIMPWIIGSDLFAAHYQQISRQMAERPPMREARLIHPYAGHCPPRWKIEPQVFYSAVRRASSYGCLLEGSDPHGSVLIDYLLPQERVRLQVEVPLTQ